MKIIREAKGTDALPNRKFWIELIAIIKVILFLFIRISTRVKRKILVWNLFGMEINQIKYSTQKFK